MDKCLSRLIKLLIFLQHFIIRKHRIMLIIVLYNKNKYYSLSIHLYFQDENKMGAIKIFPGG